MDTPVRSQGPGRSLPGSGAGHPLYGAGGHGERSTIRNMRGMASAAEERSDRVQAGKVHKFAKLDSRTPEP